MNRIICFFFMCRELSSELKDVCLSFSLFLLLRRRFFGFACAEASQRKTHDFVFKGLLSNHQDDGSLNYDMIFRVIEVELAFMYDFFFTKYVALYYGSKKVSAIWSMAAASLMSVTIYQQIASVLCNRNGSNSKPEPVGTTTSGVVVTVVILACIALLEFIQVLVFWGSIWCRVSFVCHYVREQATKARRRFCMELFQKMCCRRLREIVLNMAIGISRSRPSEHYYRNKLGQYSFLESVVRHKYKQQNGCKVGFRRFIRRYCSLVVAPDFGYLCDTNKGTCETCSYQDTSRNKEGSCPFPPAHTGCPSEWRVVVSVQ